MQAVESVRGSGDRVSRAGGLAAQECPHEEFHGSWPALINANGWGEPRLGGSPENISDSLAVSRGALKNKTQRAERLNRTQEVGGSNPLVSTIFVNVSE